MFSTVALRETGRNPAMLLSQEATLSMKGITHVHTDPDGSHGAGSE